MQMLRIHAQIHELANCKHLLLSHSGNHELLHQYSSLQMQSTSNYIYFNRHPQPRFLNFEVFIIIILIFVYDIVQA